MAASDSGYDTVQALLSYTAQQQLISSTSAVNIYTVSRSTVNNTIHNATKHESITPVNLPSLILQLSTSLCVLRRACILPLCIERYRSPVTKSKSNK